MKECPAVKDSPIFYSIRKCHWILAEDARLDGNFDYT